MVDRLVLWFPTMITSIVYSLSKKTWEEGKENINLERRRRLYAEKTDEEPKPLGAHTHSRPWINRKQRSSYIPSSKRSH